MISIPSTYSSPVNQPFTTSDTDSSGTAAGGGLRPTGNTGQQQDTVTLSGQGRELSAQNPTDVKQTAGGTSAPQGTEKQKDKTQQAQDLEVIQQLKKRDTVVRTHEQAHLAVAGRYAAGSVSYTYQTGPDGVKYATGGEVPIDISSEKSPEASIQKMETVRRAALAPADPSSADRQIAAEASAKEMQAMEELQAAQQAKAQSQGSSPAETGTASNQTVGSTSSPDSSSTSGLTPVASGPLSSGKSFQMMIQTYQAMASLA